MKFIVYALSIFVSTLSLPTIVAANSLTTSESPTTIVADAANKENDAQFYNNRGLEKFQADNLQGAIEDFDLAIVSAPQDPQLYFNRGFVKNTINDYAGALADLDRAIELKPDFAEAIAKRAYVREKLNDFEGSLRDYDRAIELSPSSEELYVERGILKHMQLKDIPSALIDYDKAVSLDPQDAYNYGFRGLAKRDLGDVRGAIEDLRQGVSLAREQGDSELAQLFDESLQVLLAQ
jgi:tetratricopeptide (TPR) repeat protein